MNGLVKAARSKTRLKKLRVDVDIIKQRKRAYGDNFEDIKKSWSKFLGIKLTTQMVCKMMAKMKETRISHIKSQLNDLKTEPDFLINQVHMMKFKELNESLEDSQRDRDNYYWIASNFEEYRKF